MKTAISVPNDIFHRAEQFASEVGVSRCELYATALREYLAEREATRVTERLDEVCAREASSLNAGFAGARAAAIGREEW